MSTQSFTTPDILPEIPALGAPPKEPYLAANERINADDTFNAQLARLLKHFDDVPEKRLRQYAGAVKDELGNINETVLDCLAAAMGPQHPIPDDVRQIVVTDILVRELGTVQFKNAWAAYIVACRDRKSRIGEATATYRAQAQVIRARIKVQQDMLEEELHRELKLAGDALERALGEPVPEAPRKG